MLAAVLAAEWLKADDSTKYLKALPGALLGIALFMGGWAGLWAIANKCGGGLTTESIADANELSPPYLLQVGQKLKLPGCSGGGGGGGGGVVR